MRAQPFDSLGFSEKMDTVYNNWKKNYRVDLAPPPPPFYNLYVSNIITYVLVYL